MPPREDELLVCRCGIEACDEILKFVGIDVEKALDPLDPLDFLVMVERMAQRLVGKTFVSESAAMKAALQTLDVDWANMTAGAREGTIRAATIALDAARRGVLPSVKEEFELRGPRTVKDTRAAVIERFKLDIEATFTTFDQRVAEHVVASQHAYVRDAYGRRSEAFSEMAREKVAQGLEQGLGRADIAESLQRMTGAAELARGAPYWRIVAAAFIGRARNNTHIGAFSEARIDRYKFIAVLDERTTVECRMLDGRIWAVPRAMDTIRRSMDSEKPEDIRYTQPWLRTGKDESGQAIIYYTRPDGGRQIVADVVRSGVGVRDDRGEFRMRMDPREMEAGGIQMPPLHELCRSTVSTLV